MPAAKDLSGMRFGRLVVTDYSHNKGDRRYFSALCDCGKTHIASGGNLVSGQVRSCGCLREDVLKTSSLKHGGRVNLGDRTYQSWSDMRKRCNNPKSRDFAMYGGRGISVCERWNDYSKFLDDMGERPVGKTIDRIDNNKGYEPSNCQWSDKYQQALNRTNHPRWNKITIDSVEYPSLARASAATGKPLSELYQILHKKS